MCDNYIFLTFLIYTESVICSKTVDLDLNVDLYKGGPFSLAHTLAEKKYKQRLI